MTTQVVYGPFGNAFIPTGNNGMTTAVLNASNNGFASFFAADDVATHGGIAGALISCSAITSPPVYRVSLQGMSSRGTPDGVIKGGGTPASVTFTPTATVISLTFANPFTPSIGDALALVAEYFSGTIGASNTATCNVRPAASGMGMPYSSTLVGGTWGSVGAGAILTPVYNDGYVGRGFIPAKAIINNISNASTYGSLFTPSMALTFAGCWTTIRGGASTSTVQATLYEGTSTTVASTTIVSQSIAFPMDTLVSSTGNALSVYLPMPKYQCVAGRTYRLMIANSGTNYAIFTSYQFVTQAALQSSGAFAGSIATGGTFTDYNSGSDWRAMPVFPSLDQIDQSGGTSQMSRVFTGQ